MIQQVAHTESGGDPGGVGLALAVAYELHAPTGAARAPEVANASARRAGRAATARRRTARA
ncbi:hypothetical protein [Streptomyces sp. NPDC056948]|uniref:hypothetical protein n=1 Tax=Streptomyces sp. NPDC056948 TaxID=3345975 RepID=UPI003645128C